jgi:LysM repeat protein
MRKLMLLALLVLCSGISFAQAQSDDTCSNVANTALLSVSELCTSLSRNSACYGANDVESITVADPRPEDFFIAPGDRAELQELREIQPQAFDEVTQTFGVSLLNVQANLPNTLPGQGVVFLLMGSARLTNEVAPDSTDETPFQSFYFLPSAGETKCFEAEPMLTIQTTGSITTTLMFNGVRTEFTPGTLLTITPSVCTIHRGTIIRGNGPNPPAVLTANETVEIFIDDAGAINVTNRRPITETEYERGEQIQSVLNTLAVEEGWLEQFVLPPAEFAPEPIVAGSADCPTQHTVAAGQSLHRIATSYDTSVQSIIDANQLENPRVIYEGQVLCIPEPGSGFVPLGG